MSTRDDNRQDGEDGRQALVAEYMLGLLSSGAHERAGRLIEDDQNLRAERDFRIARFAALNDEYEDVPVPSHIYASIEVRTFGEVVKARPAVRFWESLTVWRSIAAVALAVAVAAIGFSLLQSATDVSSLTAQLVAALEAEGGPVKFVALYDGRGNVRLTALSGSAVPDRDFELWAIQDGNNPVSMGVVPANERSAVTISPEIMTGRGSVLIITLEQKGGSPDGNPHGPIVTKGAVTNI
ncbi:MAG: anti-sigma factor [Candidatus Devosia euplotis]|nr:anti-sigma factor [Candidatus Devosia euplotis]